MRSVQCYHLPEFRPFTFHCLVLHVLEHQSEDMKNASALLSKNLLASWQLYWKSCLFGYDENWRTYTFSLFPLTAALIEAFNGHADSVTAVPPSAGDSASLSLPLVLQLGISEPSHSALQASAAPAAPSSIGTSSQQAAFGNPATVLQSPEVPVPHSTQFAASHQDFLQHTQTPPQPIVQGLSVVAGASAPTASSATEPLPAVVQTVPVGANSVLTSNPTITITPSQSTAILQSSIVMGEQNLQWILNGATGSPQSQEQMVSIFSVALKQLVPFLFLLEWMNGCK